MAAEAHKFQTETRELLKLVTHALYSNKEIFLRELISNSSDALDKLRFTGLSKKDVYENDSDLKIRVEFDEKAKTITVSDNGIGMNREEIIDNLGTIAKSGTKEFFEQLTGDQSTDSHLIGQFGVGFYSAFIVADKVTVKSRKAGESESVCWISSGEGEYTIEATDKSSRGTEITLHLKEDQGDFLSDWTLKGIIHKYSDHISWPIVMKKEVTPEVKEGEEKEDAEKAAPIFEDETVNRATALWRLPKSKIKQDEYEEFYKHIAHDFEKPLVWSHNKVEGKQDYITLLYIPSHAPFDLMNREQRWGLKLFAKRVFIMDDAEQFLPSYLRFVKGIVDSDDLPLNISREILQDNKLIGTIRSASVKKLLGLLERLAENNKDKYAEFWKNFGNVMKEGIIEDQSNKDDIAKLLRFSSTHTDKEAQTISLKDYMSRMKKGQDKIYFITADSFNSAKHSPHLEIFRKKDIEVLILFDPIDEWLTGHLAEFDGKKLQSVARGELDLGDVEDKDEQAGQEKEEKSFENVINQVKEILGEQVKDVRLTHRLTDSPACVVVDENDMGVHMQRILEAAGQQAPEVKPIFEINPQHPIIDRLHDEQDDDKFSEWTHILFDQAILAEGGQLKEPAHFVKRLNTMLLELAG